MADRGLRLSVFKMLDEKKLKWTRWPCFQQPLPWASPRILWEKFLQLVSNTFEWPKVVSKVTFPRFWGVVWILGKSSTCLCCYVMVCFLKAQFIIHYPCPSYSWRNPRDIPHTKLTMSKRQANSPGRQFGWGYKQLRRWTSSQDLSWQVCIAMHCTQCNAMQLHLH